MLEDMSHPHHRWVPRPRDSASPFLRCPSWRRRTASAEASVKGSMEGRLQALVGPFLPDFEALEEAVGVLLLVGLLADDGSEPPGIVDHRAEPVTCTGAEVNNVRGDIQQKQRRSVSKQETSPPRGPQTYWVASFYGALRRSSVSTPGNRSRQACRGTWKTGQVMKHDRTHAPKLNDETNLLT